MTIDRRQYDPEFKRNAVALALEPGKVQANVARSLGIHPRLLSRWVSESKEHGNNAFSGNGTPILTEEQRRIRELESRLKDAEIERDILKKAVAIFSKAPK